MSKSVDTLTKLRSQVRSAMLLAVDAYLEADAEGYEFPADEPPEQDERVRKEIAQACRERVARASERLSQALNILSGTTR